MATVQNLTIEQGATFSKGWIWKDSAGDPVDLTGYTKDGQIRQNYNSTSVLLDLSSYITLGTTSGTIDLEIPDEITAALSFTMPAVWDLHLITGGDVTRFFEGKVTLKLGVTR